LVLPRTLVVALRARDSAHSGLSRRASGHGRRHRHRVRHCTSARLCVMRGSGTIVNNVQYDTQSSLLGWQSRFRWIVTPGSDFYVVYTHNWLDDPQLNRIATLDKRFASKVLYTYRF
jgi:hypothetical protein